jgi:hypothetical protein
MSDQAQADQVEAQNAQVEQEYRREEKRENKAMDSKLTPFSQSTRHDFRGDTSSPPARSLVCALWCRLSLRLYSPFLKVSLIYH